ncbi:BamA/TamA family outer membrane protein, partial [bacterium]|nr:BamA/TamA family outer membrane protein [bacterium]
NPETTQLLLNLKQKKYISEYEIQQALEKIFQSGYFSDVYAVISPSEKSVVFYLEENPVIKNILINGNNIISDEEILSVMSNKEKSLFNSRFWADGYYDIIKLYRNNKYSLAYIESVEFNKSDNTLTIEINEGIINTIKIEGNYKTKKHVIIREFPLKEGEIFNLEKAGQGITNIFSTGLFERVYLNISRGNPHPDVIINLIEKRYTISKFGVRYDIERTTRGLVELNYDNTFGIGAKSLLQMQYGRDNQSVLLKLRADRIFKTYLTYDFSIYYKKDKNFLTFPFGPHGTYTDTRRGGIFSLGMQMERFGTMTLEFRTENLDIISQPLPQFNESLDLRTIELRSTVDTQDKYPFPNNGSLYKISYESAVRILGGKVSYSKIYFTSEFYQTIKNNFTIHPRIALGISDKTLPFAERFRFGGDKSFYGVKDNELHGRTMFYGSFEARIKIPVIKLFDTYISGRYDVGGLFESYENITLKEFRHCIGGGIAFDIPFIPTEISYGRISDGEGRFYFSIGHRF